MIVIFEISLFSETKTGTREFLTYGMLLTSPLNHCIIIFYEFLICHISDMSVQINYCVPENSKEEDKKRPISPSPPAWHNCRKQIYVNRSAQKGYAIGHWPIPEAFWPDLSSSALVSNN